MATHSIYQKTCPSCSTLIELDVKRCPCGYAFEAHAQENELLAEDQAVQEEELLKEYLNARIDQAVSELQIVQAPMAHDPKNLDQANRVLNAFAQLRDLRADLDTQTTKISAARKAARAARLERGLPVGTDDESIAAPTVSSEPTAAFRSAQSAKAETTMKAAGIDTKECPQCHVILPQPSLLCFCGYHFAHQSMALPAQKHASGTSRREQRKTI